MKKILQFFFVYTIIVGAVFSYNYNMVASYENDLSKTNTQLAGINYLKDIYFLSMSVVKSMCKKTINSTDKEQNDAKKYIFYYSDKIYKQQEQNIAFKNEDFNNKLELLRTFNMSEDEYYGFLDSINHENYLIGDKSKLLFEEDRELYFLGTLVTHYMPEYLISIIISHNIVKEFIHNNTLCDKKKNIFIEQSKLINLSSKEVDGIINLLVKYENTKELQILMSNIKKELKTLNNLAIDIYNEENKENLQMYLSISEKLLELSYRLNDVNFNIIENSLKERKDILTNNITKNNEIFLFITIIISLIMYFFYKSHISNIKKDLEINKISETLDKHVVFSKTNIDGIITYASSALEKLSGFSREELIDSTHRQFKNAEMQADVYTDLWDTILAKEIWKGDILNKTKDGTPYWIRATIIPDLNKKSEIISFSAYIVDITDHKALEAEKIITQERTKELIVANEKLEKLSTIDTLTQIYNRLKLDLIIQTNCESYKRYKKVFSIIMIDVDEFKSVNDNYGHLVGDETLKSIANIVNDNIRAVDSFGRWGGEEFIIICEETDSAGAYELAEKIRKAIENHKFATIGKKTISLGISQIEENLSMNKLITKADDALYYAKNNGRNKSIIYDDTL